jgi:uncharacterized protein with FMN-binding domain
MKRAPIVLAATAAGLGATLAFSPHPRTPAAVATTSPTPSKSSSSSKSSSGSSGSTATTKTVTGDAAPNQYGYVQLKVTIVGGKITKIEPVQLPMSDPKSSEISTYAEPLLRQSALSKQSANVDAVSGATYTSDSYKTALQSALDKAGSALSSSSASAQ